MVRLLAFFLLLVAAPACAQWTQPQTFVSFDRGHGGSGHKHSHILAAPQNPIPDWPFRNINVTHVPLVDQTEPSIAINPLDSNNIIIGANDDRYLYPNDSALWAYSSTDGGWTWINQPLPGELPEWVVHATDPSVTFSSDGKAYFGNGHYRYNNYRTDVALYQSPNKGNTWEVVGYPFFNDDPNDDTTTDKYFFAIDPVPSSPFHNRMYATWVEYTEPPNVQIMASYSTDGGTTWSHRTPLTTPGYYHAPVPATAPDGTVIVTYGVRPYPLRRISTSLQSSLKIITMGILLSRV